MDHFKQEAQSPSDEFMAIENFASKKRMRENFDNNRITKKPHVETPQPNTPLFSDMSVGTPFMNFPTTPGEDFYRHPPLTPLTPTPLLPQQGHPEELAPPSKQGGHEFEPSPGSGAFSSYPSDPFNPRYSMDQGLAMPSTPSGGLDSNFPSPRGSIVLSASTSGPSDSTNNNSNQSQQQQQEQQQQSEGEGQGQAPRPPAGFPAVWEGHNPPRAPQGFVYLPEAMYQAQQGSPVVLPQPPPGFVFVHESAYYRPQTDPNQPQQQLQSSQQQQQQPQHQQQLQQQNQSQSFGGGSSQPSAQYQPPHSYPPQPSKSPRYAPPSPFPNASNNSSQQQQPSQQQQTQTYPPTPQSPRFSQTNPFPGNPTSHAPSQTPQSPRFSQSNPFPGNPASHAPPPPLSPRISQQFSAPQSYGAPSSSSAFPPSFLTSSGGTQFFPQPPRPQTPQSIPPAPFQSSGPRPPTPKSAPSQPFPSQQQQSLSPNMRRMDASPPSQTYPPSPTSNANPNFYDSIGGGGGGGGQNPNQNANLYQPYALQYAPNPPHSRSADFRYPPQGIFPQQHGQQLQQHHHPQQLLPPPSQFIMPEAPKQPESVMHQRLGLSKSPVLDALVYCALNHWGLKFVDDKVPTPSERIMFEVNDFETFLRCATEINSKNKQTNDTASRIKALRRWFDGIPNLRNNKEVFTMIAKKDEVKNEKLCKIVERMVECYNERSLHLKRDQDKGRNTGHTILTSNESEEKSSDHLPSSMTSSSSPRFLDKKSEPFFRSPKSEPNRGSNSEQELKVEDMADLI